MRGVAALLMLTSAYTVSAAAQNVSNSSVLQKKAPGPNEVWMIEFMSRGDFDGAMMTSLQQQLTKAQSEMFYLTPKRLNFGEPSASASLCLWFYLKHRRYSDMIWVLGEEDESSELRYHFVALGVFSTQLSLQTNRCSVRYDYYVERRKWIHLCVTISDALVTYVDGNVMEPKEECTFTGASEFTNDKSQLYLSGNSGKGKSISCKVADARFYLTNITSAEVNAAMTFSNASSEKYIELIEFLPKEPVGLDIGPMDKSLLTTSPSEEWVHINVALTSDEAEKVCSKFGGSLLDLSTTTQAEIMVFAFIVVEEILTNFWVEPQNESCLAISVSTSGVWQEPPSECSFLRRCLCTFPTSTNFFFIGLEYSSTSYRTPMKKVTNSLVWEAEYDYRVEYSETDYVMYLMNPMTWEVYAQTDYVESSNLMGRKTWTWVSTTSTETKTYTLTSCSEEQFTCSNGECIDLQKLCNFVVECTDFTDEQLCNFTQKRPSFYDRQLSGQDNLQVNLSLTLLRIHELDMEEATLKVSVRAEAMWRDHRVVFHNLHPGNATLIPTDDATFYWQPNIVMDGVISEDTMALSMDAEPEKMYVTADMPGKAATFGGTEVLEHLGKDVVIHHKKEKVIIMTCPLDLFNYPFDVQSCSMTLTLEGKIMSDAEWRPSSEEVIEFSSASLPLFEFIHFKKFPQEGKGNPMLFEVRIARRYGSHLLVTYLPCFMLQLIGLSVFAIPLDDLSNRLTVSISCLIVMAALFTQISSTLPVSADPKMIDVWMFVHVLLLAGVFLAIIVINELPGGQDSPQEDPPFWAKSVKVAPQISRSKDGEENKKREFSLRRAANKWTAAMFVLSYVVFVVVVMSFTLVVRQSASSDTSA